MQYKESSIFISLKESILRCIRNNKEFGNQELDEQLRLNIINLTVGLAILGLVFGAINNYFKDDYIGMTVNTVAIFVLFSTVMVIHYKKTLFELVTSLLTVEFIILFNLWLMISHPQDLKHVWLMTFPALIFFYKGTVTWLTWVGLFIISLFISKSLPFYDMAYTYHEIFYISFAIVIMTVAIYFYKARIDQGNIVIKRQKEQLELLTKELESKVDKKTQQLTELNLGLEQKVEQKAKELVAKDAMILAQSRQAAMGEMISMIAHQWRQPLSTITLQISNLKIKSMLGEQSVEQTNDALEHISNTIIYLSETIDDFQSFFKPNKKEEEKNICELVERGTNFALPRLKVANIKLHYNCQKKIPILTYPNEFAQVIINIINNAIDALLEKRVTTPIIYIEIHEFQEYITITIEDNAGGIKEDIINRIFEPYFSTKGKNGTGLGLYMSKIIIEKELQGTLEVQNSNQGACFSIKIPRQKSRS